MKDIELYDEKKSKNEINSSYNLKELLQQILSREDVETEICLPKRIPSHRLLTIAMFAITKAVIIA